MKMLYVIRHAKSSWSDPLQDDFDRPLNERGKANAPEMAGRIKAKGVRPDLMISSTAKRAQETAQIFADVLAYAQADIQLQDQLYEAATETVMKCVRQISPEAESAFIFGHNPTLTYFVNELAGVWIDNIPTCGMVAISLDGWDKAGEGTGKLVWFDFPKNT